MPGMVTVLFSTHVVVSAPRRHVVTTRPRKDHVLGNIFYLLFLKIPPGYEKKTW